MIKGTCLLRTFPLIIFIMHKVMFFFKKFKLDTKIMYLNITLAHDTIQAEFSNEFMKKIQRVPRDF